MSFALDPRIFTLETELTRVRREVERTLEGLTEQQLHQTPAPEAWSAAQIVWHLAKVERGVARMLEKLDAALDPMATVPPGPPSRAVLNVLDKYSFLDRTRKLTAPEPLRPPVEIDYVAERARWDDGRVQLLDAIRASGPRLSLLRYDHPFFGPFDGWQWAVMVARHEERHHLQLREALDAIR